MSAWGIAAVVVVLAVVASALLWNRWNGAASPEVNSVAVLPFENTAQDPDIDYIGDGLTDALIDHLSRVGSLKVMARATVMRFKGQRDPQEAARALGVGAVVTGALARRGNQILISAELIDGATGERLWGQTFDRPTTDLMSVQDTIVLSIAEGLRLRLSGEQKARLGGYGTNNAEAYELYLKGRFLMQDETEEGDLEARALFMQAVEKDPKFLDAHLAIASTWARSGGGGLPVAARSSGACRRGPGEGRSHRSEQRRGARGNDATSIRDDADWAAAEREYRTVMNDPVVLRTVQFHPIALFFVAIGRPDEAVALVERALVVDPGNLESRAMLGSFLVQAGRLDEALRVYEGHRGRGAGRSAAAVRGRRRAQTARRISCAPARRGGGPTSCTADEDAARAFARGDDGG